MLSARLGRVFAFILFTITPSQILPAAEAAVTLASEPDWKSECGRIGRAEYCIFSNSETQGDDVLYYLAGQGGGERKWVEEGRGIRAQWRLDHVKTPRIVTIDLGNWWILTDRDRHGKRGLFPFFVSEFMPEIERKIGGVRGERLLMGRSMGGFNASQLVLKAPKSFARAALVCPAMMTLSPYAPIEEDGPFAKRTGANVVRVALAKIFFRSSFQSVEAWRQANPLEGGADLLGENTPPLFVSGNTQDSYGFYPGFEEFVRIARERSASEVISESVIGDHCSYTDRDVARFIVPVSPSE